MKYSSRYSLICLYTMYIFYIQVQKYIIYIIFLAIQHKTKILVCNSSHPLKIRSKVITSTTTISAGHSTMVILGWELVTIYMFIHNVLITCNECILHYIAHSGSHPAFKKHILLGEINLVSWMTNHVIPLWVSIR